MDSRASTPFHVMFGMEVSLLVRARGPLCPNALMVEAGVGAALAVAGPFVLNGSSNTFGDGLLGDEWPSGISQ
jgi:hypothetical protein